jgi:hypothetical protein
MINPSIKMVGLATAVTLFVEAEILLADRHHGPKGRKQALADQILTAYPGLTADLVDRHIEWAVGTVEMGFAGVNADVVAETLTMSWEDGWGNVKGTPR